MSHRRLACRRVIAACAVGSTIVLGASAAHAQFSYNPPGQLEAGNAGRVDYNVYVPGMRFPIENAPAYANSQVWGNGGSQGGGGGQCDAENFSYPWSDNYCEPRQWDMPMCPSGTGHQGQDIRASTCENKVHPTVAAEGGTITSIGTYSVNLQTPSGTRHRYLHMDPATLQVAEGAVVTQGQRLGYVSNAFGGTPTTVHLHYDIQQNVSGLGTVYVPTYMSLVTSYESLLGVQPCEAIPAEGGIVDNLSRCFRLYGPPASWRFVEGAGHEGSLYWTYAWTDPEPGNWAEWQLDFAAGGEYEVAVHVLPEYSGSARAKWSVTHGGTREDLVVDQAGASGWFVLGTYAFAAGASQSVAVYDNTGEPLSEQRRLMADAVRLTPVTPTPPMDPTADTAPGDTSPADTTTGEPDSSSGDTSIAGDTTTSGDTATTPDTVVTSPDTSGSGDDTGGGGDATSTDTGGPADDLAPIDDCSCATVRSDSPHPAGRGVLPMLAGLFGLLLWRRRNAP